MAKKKATPTPPRVSYDVIVIGCGGTGTYFLKEMTRFLSSLEFSKKNKVRSIHICDADIVEEKNLNRQCFQKEDIGCYKSLVMKEALGDAFGLENKLMAHTHYISKEGDIASLVSKSYTKMELRIPVIIGCVDNHQARLVCESYFEKVDNCIYFDSANEFSSGECIYAYKLAGKVLSPCRSFYFPEIKKGRHKKREEMSCTELNAVAPQHIMANMSAGLNLLSAFIQLIESNMLLKGMTMFNPFIGQNTFFPYKEKEVSGDA